MDARFGTIALVLAAGLLAAPVRADETRKGPEGLPLPPGATAPVTSPANGKSTTAAVSTKTKSKGLAGKVPAVFYPGRAGYSKATVDGAGTGTEFSEAPEGEGGGSAAAKPGSTGPDAARTPTGGPTASAPSAPTRTPFDRALGSTKRTRTTSGVSEGDVKPAADKKPRTEFEGRVILFLRTPGEEDPSHEGSKLRWEREAKVVARLQPALVKGELPATLVEDGVLRDAAPIGFYLPEELDAWICCPDGSMFLLEVDGATFEKVAAVGLGSPLTVGGASRDLQLGAAKNAGAVKVERILKGGPDTGDSKPAPAPQPSGEDETPKG